MLNIKLRSAIWNSSSSGGKNKWGFMAWKRLRHGKYLKSYVYNLESGESFQCLKLISCQKIVPRDVKDIE